MSCVLLISSTPDCYRSNPGSNPGFLLNIVHKVNKPETESGLSLKGVYQEIFKHQFFPWFKPIWDPDKQYFRIRFPFCRDIQSQSCLCETIKKILSKSKIFFWSFLSWSMCLPLKGFLLIVSLKATIDKRRFRFWFCGVQFISGGMLHTVKVISAQGFTLRRWSLRYVAHRGYCLHGVLHTEESTLWSTKLKPNSKIL